MRLPTALSLARQFLTQQFNKGITEVSNMDLHRYIAERLHQSRAVLNGTLDGTGPGSLLSAGWYTTTWRKQKLDNGRIIHCRITGGGNITAQREMDYNYPVKRKACERIMSHLPKTGRPRILTLAASHGNCVQAAVRRNPNVVIDNIEERQDILDVWKITKAALDVETSDYHCSFQDFVNAPGFSDCPYALINADVMGYACERMYQYLGVVNKARNARIVAITTQCLNNFRNHGDFQDRLRKKYAGSEDKHAECIADWMHNYTMIDRFAYQKDAQTRKMEVFIFQLDE